MAAASLQLSTPKPNRQDRRRHHVLPKENVVVTLNTSGAGSTPKKSSSVPLGMESAGQGPAHQHQGSSSKKRKLFTQSLGMIRDL